ncbi:PQQ-binding-like beta-propeller repeat protein [Streptomyces sp. WMMC500]|uniref:PQQ-binding-like beta-propeller repeat protein n=1 Tax=Streptomyces sp. WMMC500 TaxID=3015154 RepID=UPI00248C56D3|nr:PQQ-binding-like beta-propeller repeat protein [Streptomyces sp. WMMC500]WBB62704.1 PQQ-binding-like beta-propeller repeat protein [Streptomyces sp. WMMC500]
MHTLTGSGGPNGGATGGATGAAGGTTAGGPRQGVGPHRIVAPLGPYAPEGGPGADGPQFHLAFSEPLGRVVVLMTPPAALAADPGFRVRFASEAGTSARLAGPAAAPVAGVAPQDEEPWVAYDCAPALPLPAALAAHGGPLPVPYVCQVGVSLAAAVLQAHAQGLVYAGLTPAAVLLTAAGPRLVAYGAVRAAAPGDGPRTAVPGLPPAWLPPEQHAGGVPRPLGDIYALGVVLAYAATGAHSPDPGAVPEPLAAVLAGCLAPDPAQRPRADALLQQLQQAQQALPAEPGQEQVPGAVAAALAAQVPALPAQGPLTPPPGPGAPGGPGGPPLPGQTPDTSAGAGLGETSVSPARPGRRALLRGLAFGAAGLAVGGGGVYAYRRATKEDPPVYRTTPAKGAPPKPLWQYPLQGQEARVVSLIGRIAVVQTMGALTAVNVRTGKKAWDSDVFADAPLIDLGRGEALVTGTLSGIEVVELAGGKSKGPIEEYSLNSKLALQEAVGAADGILYFLATVGSDLEKFAMVAYDTRKGEEVWNKPLPEGYGDLSDTPLSDGERMKIRGRELLIPSAPTSGFAFTYLALDRRSGDKAWEQKFEDIKDYDGPGTFATDAGTLVSPDNEADTLRGFEMRGAKKLWERPTKEHFFSELTDARSRVLYGTQGAAVTALSVQNGKPVWRTPVYSGGRFDVTDVVLSGTGRTLFYSNDAEVQAFDTRDGAPLWRFATVSEGGSSSDDGPGVSGRVLAADDGIALVLSKDALYALPVD